MWVDESVINAWQGSMDSHTAMRADAKKQGPLIKCATNKLLNAYAR